MPDFCGKHNFLLITELCRVSQGLDNSCSSEYEANSGIQNKTAKGSIIFRFLSVHLALKKVSLRIKRHTRLTPVCLFFRFFYQHGDFFNHFTSSAFPLHYVGFFKAFS